MNTYNILLKLIRIALGKESDFSFPVNIPWSELLQLADKQQVTAVTTDGILISGISVPHSVKMEWISRVAICEQAYEQHMRMMVRLALAYHQADIRMMVLKGWGLSLNYPVPSHRPSGDLDIWNFGQWKEADALIESKGIKIDNSHHHHSVFSVKGLMVENHYDFVNVYVRRSNKVIEEKLKELANNGYQRTEVENTAVYLPSVDFNALFLLRHTASHFSSAGISLRQVLDWGLFMERYHHRIEWDWYLPFIKKLGMYPFFVILNTICMEQLSIAAKCFHGHTGNSPNVSRVLKDIFYPEYGDKKNGTLFTGIRVKSTRWWHNRWKHRLCYTDGLASSFVYGLWAKMLKPTHFVQ